ncbi:heme-binding domain-containing protein [Mariniflexile sp. HMF6888]|uniref:heme-binding domain-containing protein n=1 Tax=Mariniflexile sp. HMF6888 TaxID=3373086 RepID=UPI0037ABC312
MKIVKIVIMILCVVFVGIQFIPTKRNESHLLSTSDFMMVNTVPKPIESKIKESCYDCHSNHTNYPWYNKIQPIAWFMEDHIKEGKKELNFSDWENVSDRRKKSKLKSIISQIKNDEMPLSSYTLIHRDAIFSVSDKKLIVDWFQKLMNSI